MNLYSRRMFLASAVLALTVLPFVVIHAQRRSAHKLRATSLLEVTTDNVGVVTVRVVPVAILDEGRFRDAGIYKSTPRPMALDNGIVYEAQKSGTPAGYVTIVNGVNNGGWTALGKWQAIAAKKSEPQPTPAANPDERPILHHGGAGASPSPAPATTPSSDQSSAQPAPATAPEDPDRPVLRKRAPEKPEPSSTPAQTASPPEGAVPRATPPVFTPGTVSYVGVSDTESSDVRSFAFPWKPGEEQQMEVKMRKLALAQLPRENSQLTPNSLSNVVMRSFDLDMSNDAVIVFSAEVPGSYLTPGGSPSSAGSAPSVSSKPGTSGKGASGKPGTSGRPGASGKTDTSGKPDASNTPGKFVSRYVTVIARVNFEGVPQMLASSVTDSTRLDVAPRLELVDAVDVDGDGLAELLFREYSFDEKSFIIYGVGRNAVTKVFEGASLKLK